MADVTPRWYYSVGGERFGPVSLTELKELAGTGKLTATSLVWKKGMVEWVPANKIQVLLPTQASASPLPFDDSSDNSSEGGEPITGGLRPYFPIAIALTVIIPGVVCLIWWATTRDAKPTQPTAEPPVAAVATIPIPPAPAPIPKATPNPLSTAEPKPIRLRPSGDGEKLSVTDLLDCFKSNALAASERYVSATITITGKLSYPATKHPSGEIEIQIPGANTFAGPFVWCRMAPTPDLDVSHFPPGATISLRGRCTGVGAAKGPSGSKGAKGDDVVLEDCVMIGDPLIPTPDGTDYPNSITFHEIEVRITAVQTGYLTVVLAAGAKAGAEAQTSEKYLVFRLQVRNTRKPNFMTSIIYSQPTRNEVYLRDEKGNTFDYSRSGIKIEADSVVARELKSQPKLLCQLKGESTGFFVDPGKTETYFLIFSPEKLGKGKRLFLTLDRGLFDKPVPSTQRFRFEQTVIENLSGSISEPPADPAFDAKVVALTTQLAKSKVPAERMRAAEELAKHGKRAKAATAALCLAVFDPVPQVRVSALDAMKSVNPAVYVPVATITTPLTNTDFQFLGSTGRPEAVEALAKLGEEARPAVPILIAYKRLISRPGGWPHVAQVIEALVELAPDDPAVVTLLVAAVKDGYADARRAAVNGLAKTTVTKESVTALGAAAQSDTVPEIRLAAVTALTGMGAEAKFALKNLEAAKTDSDARVREAARIAIEKVK